MGIVRRGDNFRRDLPEAQKFIYPDDSQRITGKDAKDGAALLGGAALEGLGRLGIPLPFRALGPFAKKIKQVANRPDATSSMHREYLNNKYGNTGWDVYEDRLGIERRNKEFFYNEQDLGNGSSYTQRENKRFAGEALSDEWLQDIKAHGIEQDMLEEMIEQKTQRAYVDAIHGKDKAAAFLDPSDPSISSEQQLAQAILKDRVANPTIQPDRVLAKNLVQPDNVFGIDDRYYRDSEIRGEVAGKLLPDGSYDLRRTGVDTEILSPDGQDKSYAAWKGGNQRGATSLANFNEAAAEYYGQQALKMRGATPVSDAQRTQKSKSSAEDPFRKDDPTTTVGTDRLIEHTRSLGSGPISVYEPADYRFVNPRGEIQVVDYQTGSTNPEDIVSMNLFKASQLRPGDEREFVKALQREALLQENPDLDSIMGALLSKGQYGEMQPSKAKAAESGFRSGKFTGDGKNIGVHDRKADNTAYEGVLFGLTDEAKRSKKGGYIPDELKMMSGENIRKVIGQQLKDGTFNGKLYVDPKSGSVNVSMPSFKGGNLLSDSQQAIISEPYRFNQAQAFNKVNSHQDESIEDMYPGIRFDTDYDEPVRGLF